MYTQANAIVFALNCKNNEVCMESFAKFIAYCTSLFIIWAMAEDADGGAEEEDAREAWVGNVMYSSCLA